MGRTVGTLCLLLLVVSCSGGGVAVGGGFACNGVPIDLTVLEADRKAADLGPAGQEALRAADEMVPPDVARWTVVEESDRRVALLREVPAERAEEADGRSHEFLSIAWVEATNVHGWMVDAAGFCSLERRLEGANPAEVRVDDTAPAPDAEATEIPLLVNERACASGRSAEGRIRVADLELTDEAVRVVIGVVPRGGDQNCPGNPDTPFVLELPEPLGDRALVDASVHPPRELWPAP